VDGDGIPYRTLPGNEHPRGVYFNRGSGHNELAQYSEKAEDWHNNMVRLARKFETARRLVPGPTLDEVEGARVAIISYGSTLPAIEEGRYRLANEALPTSFLRLRALPINDEVRDFVARYDRVYVVEANHDGQMCQILRMEMPELAGKLISLSFMDGLPLTARWLVSAIEDKEKSL
jgi:2-oxoglutarate/2-oxoacid ferredoxin oxidoreductase subunit alpha